MQPILSVLITSYNREEYITDSIESIILSTYSNWELIIVDDSSTDTTFDIAKSFAKKDKRIRVFQNEKNLGQFKNRNKAAKLAKGKYIKYLDSDDMIYPYALELMVSAMEKYSDAGIAISNSNGTSVVEQPYPFKLSSNEAYLEHYYNGAFLAHGPSASIFKKKLFDAVGGYEFQYGIFTDFHLSLKIAAISPVVLLPRDLIYWRVHFDQVTIEQKDSVRGIIERYKINYDIITAKDCPLSAKERDKLIYLFTRINSHHFLKNILMGKIRKAFIIKQNTKICWKSIVFSILTIKILKKIRLNLGYRTVYDK